MRGRRQQRMPAAPAGTVAAMPAAAAFFDLDRTLVGGATGSVIGAELREAGVVTQSLPGEDLLYRAFNLIGETWPTMLLIRQGARMAKGWSRESVVEAGERAADRLIDDVQPYARLLIDGHREAGRPVVLATTTPYDLVKPLADRLGLDSVVATRYGVEDGRYDGTIQGEFVWGRGKLHAVRAWAAQHDVRLQDSYAYSDSFYDFPLLDAVGHPSAVNPDPRLVVIATLRRWPVVHLDVPAGVPKLAGIEPQQLLFPIVRPELFPFARFDIRGTERIPKEGAAILVSNHRSYFDPLTIGLTVAKRGRPVRFLGKKEVFDAPVVGQVAKALGGIRVDRATGGDEPLRAAAQALEAGDMVAILPQGTIPRGYAFFEPELQGRWGAARLAAMTGAPVVPLGLWGTERVWPRNARLPDVFNVTNPPKVRVRVGDPVEIGREDPDTDTKAIMAAIADLLPPEARRPHEPTREELERTLPPGYEGDPKEELDRRPGED